MYKNARNPITRMIIITQFDRLADRRSRWLLVVIGPSSSAHLSYFGWRTHLMPSFPSVYWKHRSLAREQFKRVKTFLFFSFSLFFSKTLFILLTRVSVSCTVGQGLPHTGMEVCVRLRHWYRLIAHYEVVKCVFQLHYKTIVDFKGSLILSF